MLKAVPTMLAMIGAQVRGLREADVEKIMEITRDWFPEVPAVSTSTLDSWMANESDRVCLVDVRAPAEFEVSHLKGAVNLRGVEEIGKYQQGCAGQKIVLYCSVGFRSAQIISRIKARETSNFYNLEGSIFKWVNERRPVFSGANEVNEIHPYGKLWRGLVRSDIGIRYS